MISRLFGLVFATLLAGSPIASQNASIDQMKAKILAFSELDGWEADDHDAALAAYIGTCDRIGKTEWPALCELAKHQEGAKAFFEVFFRPVLIEDGSEPLFTGYFEPELFGSRVRTNKYRYPLYKLPKDVRTDGSYYTRRAINNGALSGKGLEIAWVDDPVELFFLQVQGSGRVTLTNGSKIRVGYAGHNGHNYRSIGKELVSRGIYEPHQVSAKVIQNWVRRNPIDGPELLNSNPSYVFFTEKTKLRSKDGPIGAMNRSIFTMRTVAVDPKYVPLGAPVWIEKDGKDPLRRLMIAQDTGSAIKGAQRADIFYGTGDDAGSKAGAIKDSGRMIVFMPIQAAFRFVELANQ